MARKTPGIYIAIRGDYSAFETDLNRAKKMAQAQGDAIAKSIGNAVSKADLTGGINKLTRELKTAQAALSAGAFKGQVSGLEEIAKAAGVSSKQLEGLTNSMLKSQAAATANRAFEYLQKNAGLSTLELGCSWAIHPGLCLRFGAARRPPPFRSWPSVRRRFMPEKLVLTPRCKWTG